MRNAYYIKSFDILLEWEHLQMKLPGTELFALECICPQDSFVHFTFNL